MASKPNAADLLYGAAAIADHLGMSRKQVYHLHEQRKLPTFNVGATICARGSTISRHFARMEKEAR